MSFFAYGGQVMLAHEIAEYFEKLCITNNMILSRIVFLKKSKLIENKEDLEILNHIECTAKMFNERCASRIYFFHNSSLYEKEDLQIVDNQNHQMEFMCNKTEEFLRKYLL